MSGPSHGALRILLIGLLMTIGGILLAFGGKPLILRLFLQPPAEIFTLLLFTLKKMGGFGLMLSVMLFLAACDPVRNVAIIDALIVGLCVLTITPLLSKPDGGYPKIYPRHLIWGRVVIRLALAALLYFLRSRDPFRKPAGVF